MTPAGATVRVTLRTADVEQAIHAELSAERFSALAPKKARVFATYQI